ncbi:MAG: hypothetical protein HY951_03475 [Bacteroidia bacterium]|nr:hypothetical protein [Bacteroidia bacterium]
MAGLFDFLFGVNGDIKVEAFRVTEILKNTLINDFAVVSIELRITNNSGKTIFIEKPIIRINKKVHGKNEYDILSPAELYPLQLRESKVHLRKFALEQVFFDKLVINSKIRFVVADTLGNTYSSKKYKVSEFLPDV